MCGIAGIVHLDNTKVDPCILKNMADTISHRGPDDEKFLFFDRKKKRALLLRRDEKPDINSTLGFAHLRLSIIDLSSEAAQPMSDSQQRYWIIHNGEVFNYIELRQELIRKGYRFRSQSDTEVILYAYIEWGENCLTHFNGMWAFVIYDSHKKKLFGARDRFGIKPFFYTGDSSTFAFASEIKALLQLPAIKRQPYLPAIKDYLYHSRVDTSRYTFFEDIFQLEPGFCFSLDLHRDSAPRLKKWWDIRRNLSDPPLKINDAADSFRALLLDSIKIRLRSDVPIGICLSGGLDSSAIVSLSNPFLEKGSLRTFSIVQPGHPFDETYYIDRLISHFKVLGKKKAIDGNDLMRDLMRLIKSHDEPFTSTSMYAQWKVFEMAKNCGVTVTLDGQGADESLGGYPYFKPVFWGELLKNRYFLTLLRELRADSQSPLKFLENSAMLFSGFLSHRTMIQLAKLKSPQYSTHWINNDIFKNVSLPHASLPKFFSSQLNQRLYEVFAYDGLPALLRYADRNSMAHSLESRMPFLDYRLVSYLFSLPSCFKIRDGFTKYIMRKALREDVPSYILQRRDKVPFLTSEALWFRQEMKGLIQNLLHSDSFLSRAYIIPRRVQSLYQKHVNREVDASRPLWRIINLELWLRQYMDVA